MNLYRHLFGQIRFLDENNGDGSDGGGGSGSGDGNAPNNGGAGDGGSGGGTPSTDSGSRSTDGGEPWYNSLPEDLRADPNVTRYESVEELAKGLINANKIIGQGGRRVIVPDETATDADWNEFFAKVGRPESPDKYGLEYQPPEDAKDVYLPDDGFKQGFSEQAHNLGLTEKQAKNLWSWLNDGVVDTNKQIIEHLQNERTEAESALKKEWGSDYDRNVETVNRLLTKFATEEELKTIRGIMGNNPDAIRVLNKIASSLSEDVINTDDLNRTFGKSRAAAQQELDDVMGDPKHPYWDRDHVNHKQAVAKVQSLNEILHGKDVVATVGTMMQDSRAAN